MSRAPRTLQTLLLATIFVAGNLVLPGVDVFLDHGLDAPRTEHRVHFERIGGCRDHVEHCVLSRLLSDLGNQAPASVTTSRLVPAAGSRSRSADPRSVTPRPHSQHLSRAPPAPLA